MKAKLLLLSIFFLLHSPIFAQTKFSGIIIDQPYTTFCTELSKKHKMALDSKIVKPSSKSAFSVCTFDLNFLGIEGCHMNVYSKDSLNKVHELEIVIPPDMSIESFGEKGLKHYVIGAKNFIHIFEVYKNKYGNKHEWYVREGRAWDDIRVEWKLPDAKIILQISKSKYSEDEEYHSTCVFYMVEKHIECKQVTIDDI